MTLNDNFYITDDGVFRAVGMCYECVITKEMFIEAYNKWIKDGGENRKEEEHESN